MGSLLPTHAQAVIIGPVLSVAAPHIILWNQCRRMLVLEPTQIFSDDPRAKTVQPNAISEAGR